MSRLLAIIFLFLSFITVKAQSIRLYTAEELSSNQITSLCQDRQGYIWIGTEYGLNKFDGVYVKQYYNDEERPQSLLDNIVRMLFTDRDGVIWVVTNRGVQWYNRTGDSFETVTFDGDPHTDVNDLCQAPDGSIWMLHAERGVYTLSPGERAAQPLETVNALLRDGNRCDNMFLDNNGNLWIAFENGGLQRINPRTQETHFYHHADLQNNRVVDLAENQGRIYASTYGSLLQYNAENDRFQPLVSYPRMAVQKLFPGQEGHLLTATSGNGLWDMDLQTGTCSPVEEITPQRHANLSQDKVSAYLKDRDGNVWIGCNQKGLLFADARPSPFHFLPLSTIQTNNGNVLRSVFADKNHHVYLCQERGGITSITHEGKALAHWMGQHTVMSIWEDGDDNFWVGTYRNGLYHLDIRSGKEVHVAATGDQRIGSITRDREGNLYIAAFNDGLRSFSPDGKQERTLAGGRLPLHNPYLNTLFTDGEGRIWIGHYYGIDVYDPQADKLVDMPVHPSLRSAIVYAIGQSPYDRSIWIGTNKGLFQYYTEGADKGTWKRFTTQDGLPNDIVCDLVILADGTLWISTYRGMGRITTDGTFTRYYRGNGLEEWSYLRSVGCYSAFGEVIFGNQNGITYFVPGAIPADKFSQGITLTAMRMGDIDVNASTLSGGRPILTRPLEETDHISVSHQDNTFSLRFSPMDFRDPQSIFYEFRFAGGPKGQWYRTEAGRSEIYFSHLSTGNNHLIVRACENGVFSPEKQLTIHVMPPWYRTWAAYVFYALLLVGVLVLWLRSARNRRLAEMNEDKIKFFVDISHELRSPLTLIKSPLSQLLATPQDPQTTRALRNMERNTNRLLTLTNQILSIRKMEKGQMTLHYAKTPLADFVSDICHDYDYQTEKRQVTLHFRNEAPETVVWIDRDNFDKVVTNLINNAIKYTGEKGHIDVVVREDGRFAELLVQDDGPGIDEAQLKRIFERFYQTSARPAAGQMSYGIGLNLTQKIVALHGGSVQAQNRADGQGSVFTVRLPLGTSHLPQDQLVGEDYFAGGAGADKSLPVTDADRPRKIRRKTTYHIAVVDDDDEIRHFLETELGESYHVHAYPDGQKALEGIVDTVPDLVVSDIVMPVMDGVELLKRLKASTTTSHIPVILLTTKTEHESRIKGLEEGADAYVDKPFNLEELETRIAGLIANRVRMKGKFSGAQEQQDTVRQVELKGNDAALMERIMQAINERLDDSEFNVEALGDAVGLSRVQLHRRVKDITGITVGEFIRNLRLQQAARLLEEGDITVSQVTYAVGFANPTHFSAAFKKHFGVTPSEYLGKHQKREK